MTLLSLYLASITADDIRNDEAQLTVIHYLDNLLIKLASKKKRWWQWWQSPTPPGLYLWGSVGVGKTFLMDLFFDNVPITQKKRFHFYAFMQQVDHQLRLVQGKKNPIDFIARQLAFSTQVLCFDEFMVDNVADAMILAQLLPALFNYGVTLIATSNIEPNDLYLNGMQRPRFMPAIVAIKKYCCIMPLINPRDYRLNRLPNLNRFLTPLSSETTQALDHTFTLLTDNEPSSQILLLLGREITCIKCCTQVVWFDFKTICNLPRSQLDYLEISARFHTIFISDVPKLTAKDTVFVILLIHLVDIIYDRKVRLILSAAVCLEKLYVEGELLVLFQRTLSRLQEMQSANYKAC